MSDIGYIVIYYVYAKHVYDYPDNDYTIKVLQCLVVLLSFIKLTFYLRIFDNMSYLVMML
jgi:hypothetical protein